MNTQNEIAFEECLRLLEGAPRYEMYKALWIAGRMFERKLLFGGTFPKLKTKAEVEEFVRGGR